MNWHGLDTERVLELIGSSNLGLSESVAEARLKEYGPNQLLEKKKKTPWQIFFSQFTDFMILVLIAAAIVSAFIGDITDSVIILVIVLLNAAVGFIQEYRAEKAIEALKKMAALQTVVKRGGQTMTIDASLLVPGDLILLEAGMMVPADLRLTETHALEIDEA